MRVISGILPVLGFVAMATSATAALGVFTYSRQDAGDGAIHAAALIDPTSMKCINVPEVEDTAIAPAHSPRNHCDLTATV
ncbi:hypothetical protein BGX26_006815, partial [Mortierella sp. AD094]